MFKKLKKKPVNEKKDTFNPSYLVAFVRFAAESSAHNSNQS
jgi:hypothetical protein